MNYCFRYEIMYWKSLLLVFLFAIFFPIFSFGQKAVAVDSGYVEVKKGKLFYKIFGKGEPVLFINNGGGFSSKNYEIYADLLSKSCMFIMFDQRGTCLLYTSPSPRDGLLSRMPSSA